MRFRSLRRLAENIGNLRLSFWTWLEGRASRSLNSILKFGINTEAEMKTNPHIRWMIRRDMARVLEIESGSFPHPWTEDDFICCLRQRNCIGMVAEEGEEIMGFMIYELQKNALVLLNFAVDPRYRYRGIGRAMIENLIDKLKHQRRSYLTLHVSDENLGTHLFLRRMGFRAIQVERDFFESPVQDAYKFRYTLNRPYDHRRNLDSICCGK